MTYVGFHPSMDPKKRMTRMFARRAMKHPIETMTDYSMRWRTMHMDAEMRAHGRFLVPDDAGDDGWPDRVVAYGATTREPLVVFYRTP